MSKISKVSIINRTTIRLDEDAFKGDEIDLTVLESVDTSCILDKIAKASDAVYNQKLEDQKRQLEEVWRVQLEKRLLEETGNLKAQLAEKDTKAENERLKLANVYQTKISALEHDLEQAKADKEHLSATMNDKIDLEVAKKQSEIDNLRLQKSMYNVKELGEELENWCNNEYQNYAVNGFTNCTWDKDNTAIKNDEDDKGTKADYIFRIFTDAQKSIELSSVACEMKNEAPDSKNKKRNADHFKKLDSDRTKKKCEYALLISELELNSNNDAPIRKVLEYPNMYVVRPQYFIAFLSLITTLAHKYQDVLLAKSKDLEHFKEAQEILDDFEKFKNELLEKQFAKLEKDASELVKQTEIIKKSADTIENIADDLINKAFKAMRQKIEGYKISKVVTKIENI